MSKENLTFHDIETGKHKFCCYKIAIFVEDVDIDKVLVSNRISSGEKNI